MLEKEKKQHSFPSAYLTALFTRWVHVIRIQWLAVIELALENQSTWI